MFDLRFKRVQVAIADGRLDEACELMKDPSLRAHRIGQTLLTRLMKAYIKRGQEHLKAGRVSAALNDCNQAEKLAGNTAAVMDLRAAICEAMEQNRLAARQQSRQLERAERQFENGWISAGQELLSGSKDRHAQAMLADAQFQKAVMEKALQRIQTALDKGDFELAGRMYHEQGLGRRLNEQAGALLERIRQRAEAVIREHLNEGRLSQAAAILNRMPGCVADCPSLQQARQGMVWCRQAADLIETGCFWEALLYMKKTLTVLPKAHWIRQGLQQVQEAARAQMDLQAGPLGGLENTGIYRMEKTEKVSPMRYNASEPFQMKAPMMTMKNENQSRADLPRIFVLQLDGIGAYLVCGDDQVTVGPVSSSARPDVGFIAAPDAKIKWIERTDGDYFLGNWQRGPLVEPQSRQLLKEADKIEISGRCRMKFSRPNPASGTACLILGSARLPRADVQQIILMDREILIGSGRNCHIQTGRLSETMTLFIREGHLLCRQTNGSVTGIGINQRVEIGTVGLMVVPYPGE